MVWSPEKSAGTVSLARACPSVPASIVTFPFPNDRRTELPRSATSATRLTASASGTAGMSPRLPNSSGNLDMYLMYSPPIRRVVSRRPRDSNPIIASAARCESSGVASAPPALATPSIMTRTGTPGDIIRAASASVLAGTSSVPWASGWAGFQPSSRTASRYLSVATSLTTSPSISTFTPVMTGSVSSRLAAGTTCPIAVASAPPSTVPASRGSSGSRGYSLTGSVTSVKEAGPQVRVTSSFS